MSYVQPLILFFSAVALTGLLRLRRCKGILVPSLAVFGLILLSWPPVAWLLSRPLESRYPIRPFKTDLEYQAIVVLSAAVSPPQYERPYALPDEDSFHRCRFGAWLYQRHPVPMLLCGGRDKPNTTPYSIYMRDLLVTEGVPERMIWTERQSGSTHENALYGSAILKEHSIQRIVLIVDASSMPRAQACFLKEGIHVLPAPSDFYEIGSLYEILMPTWRAIRQNELTLHESIGLGWYYIRGWI